jgi:hypothetical protein
MRRVVAVPATSTRFGPAYQVAWRYRHPHRGPQTGYFSCLDVRSISVGRLVGPFIQPAAQGPYRPPSAVINGCLSQLSVLLGMR